MKNIKILYSFLLLLAVTVGCSVPDGIDGDTSFLNSITDPAAVSALATITQDNSGKVTLTPRGEGASKFEVYFGDATAQPAIVNAGSSVVHIYKEGIYKVKVVAFGITGKKTENVQDINVSFRSPENLVVTIENDKAVSKKVTVKATADFALFYDVYFGEDPNQVPVKVNNGESTSHIYATAGTYKIKIVSKSGAIKPTVYEQDFVVTAIMAPTASAPTPPTRAAGDVVSIFSSKYTNLTGTNFFPDWGQGGQGSSWAEFDLSGDKMLQYSNLSYQGIDIGSEVNATSMQFLHVDIWTATSMSIDIYPLPNGVVPANEKFVTKSLVTNQWNSFDIPLSDFTSQGLPISNLKQFKFVGTPWAAGTVFIDNIYFYKNPSVTMVLPIDFESTVLNYNWIGFGGAITDVINNPDKTGSNTTNKVLKITKPAGAQVWAGASQELDSRINFSAGTKIKVAVWSPLANSPILLKLEDMSSGNPPSRVVEVSATTTTTGAWEILTFDLTTSNTFSSSISYDKIVLFPNFLVSNNSDLIYYFDEIKQSN